MFGNELGRSLLNSLNGGLRHRFGVNIPLVCQSWLNDHTRPISIRHRHRVIFNLLQQSEGVHICNNFIAGVETIHTLKGFRHLIVHFSGNIEDIDHRQVMTLADFEVVEIMCWRNLYGTAALFGIAILVGDNWNRTIGKRK